MDPTHVHLWFTSQLDLPAVDDVNKATSVNAKATATCCRGTAMPVPDTRTTVFY